MFKSRLDGKNIGFCQLRNTHNLLDRIAFCEHFGSHLASLIVSTFLTTNIKTFCTPFCTPFSATFFKPLGTGVLLFHVEFVFTVAHLHSLANKKFFRKFTQFGLLLQEGEQRRLLSLVPSIFAMFP